MSEPLQIDIEDAFREACTALGEALVRERFLHRRITEMETEEQEQARRAET